MLPRESESVSQMSFLLTQAWEERNLVELVYVSDFLNLMKDLAAGWNVSLLFRTPCVLRSSPPPPRQTILSWRKLLQNRPREAKCYKPPHGMGFSKNENATEGGSGNEFLPVVLTTRNPLLGNIKP